MTLRAQSVRFVVGLALCVGVAACVGACSTTVSDTITSSHSEPFVSSPDAHARLMVLLDTSSSMLTDFSTQQPLGGDSDDTALFCDNGIGTGFTCSANVPCTLENGALSAFGVADPLDNPSRMLAAKTTLYNVVEAYEGSVDFGLMRYAGEGCVNDLYCCEPQADATTTGRCFDSSSNGYRGLSWPERCTWHHQCLAECGQWGHCRCDDDTQCPDGYACDGGRCATTNPERVQRLECVEDWECVSQNCGVSGCTCGSDADCPPGFECGEFEGEDVCRVRSTPNLTYAGGCGHEGAGGTVLESPAIGSSPRVKEWVDFVEDFCSSTDRAGDRPRNPELRANGRTPLARSIAVARTDWYEPIQTEATDPLLNCRSYSFVVVTDGMDTCSDADPSDEIAKLRAANPDNPVKTYVVGIGSVDRCAKDQDCVTTCNTELGVCNCARDTHCTGSCNAALGNVCSSLDLAELNAMALAGGTGSEALIASSPEGVEEALADVLADSTSEPCNGLDDNCNGQIDEGQRVYQQCVENSQCGSGECDAGRCRCTSGTIDSCASGFVCARDGYCRPACGTGTGGCTRAGVRKCGTPRGACCADDGEAECTVLEPLSTDAQACQSDGPGCSTAADCGVGENCVGEECAMLCGGGEFPCPNGRTCRDGHCLRSAGISPPDLGAPEPNESEAGFGGPAPPDGCSCRAAGSGSSASSRFAWLGLLVWLNRRRRASCY